jgi:hypothetical protein
MLGAGCAPKNDVKPGAPVLTTFTIAEGNGTRTDIGPTTADCEATVEEAGNCDPGASATCRLTDTFCYCAAKAMGDCSIDMNDPTTGGSWVCHYGPMASVIATFDRILDGAPLDPGDAGTGRTDVVMLTATPAPATPVSALADYTATGSSTGIVFPLIGGIRGPFLTLSGQPALQAGATVAFKLDPQKVRAKDGKTPFTGMGLLQDGMLSFALNGFGASFTVPMPATMMATVDGGDPDGGLLDGAAGDAVSVDAPVGEVASGDAAGAEGGADAGASEAAVCVPPPPPPAPGPVPPDNTPVTITFNNAVDPADIVMHITVSAVGATLTADDFMIDASMAPAVNIVPKTTWPAKATITVTVDANAADATGVKLGTAASASFTTSAM